MAGLSGGLQFLLARQQQDGTWSDFLTLAGEAVDWPTAYVSGQLASAGAPAACLERAAQALRRRCQPDGGWGYHATVPTDGDSTAMALLFLAGWAGTEQGLVDAAAGCLAAHQDAGGGVRTYRRPEPIRDYMQLPPAFTIAGWTQPHTEVTAAAGRAFLAAGDRARARMAWRFVAGRQHAEGYWGSYWWQGPFLPTLQAAALAAALPGEPTAAAALRRAGGWVVKVQRADGAWSLGEGADPSAFATALALQVLVLAGGPARAVERGTRALIDLQQPDGGWPSVPILRIPPPEAIEPAAVPGWRVDALGTGVVIRDQHRLFTGATCVGALALAG